MADWSQVEIAAIIADYFKMLEAELSGQPLNKTFHRRNLSKLLNGRTDGSIEKKHQNISAVLAKLGLPYIKGYKPLSNFQKALEFETLAHLKVQKSILEPKFLQFSDKTIEAKQILDFNALVESPPSERISAEPTVGYKRPFKINYLEREQNNISIGGQGEEIAIQYEKWKLTIEGKANLAEQIEWISKYDDSAGFDILSKNLDGTDKYIEVKSTKLNINTPIFFSRNEYSFSLEKNDNFHLYRVYDIEKTPRMFKVNGSYDSFCKKEATTYLGTFF